MGNTKNPTVHVFTSAAMNYIPKVRLLFASIKKYHPEWKTHLVLADELHPSFDIKNEPFDEIHPIADLGIPHWKGWAFCHSIVELATAIKPFMLLKLLNTPGSKKVIYLDPDIVVFSKLDEIINLLDQQSIVLTPHQIKPEKELSAIIDNEICSLKHGIFNLGFIGVSSSKTGKAFAKWWAERIYYFCRDDIPKGLFTDQKWIDLVPVFFDDVHILKSSRYNVAPWNLTTRLVKLNKDNQYMVDDKLLGFYHFTGFDSGDHKIMAIKNSRNNPTVKELVGWYEAQNKVLKKDKLNKLTWSYGQYSDGTPIIKTHRLIYRDRIDLQKAFSDPFASEGYLTWLNAQGVKEYKCLNGKLNQGDQTLGDFTSHLTLGFSPQSTFSFSKVAYSLKQALKNPINSIRKIRNKSNVINKFYT